jgi:hypothetical protein
MSFLLTGTTGGAEPAITSDPVTTPLKANDLFGTDVDHVAGLCSLVPAHRLCRLQVLEPSKLYGLEHSAHGGERRRQHPGHSSERAALMAEVNGALQLLWIECPPLGAAHTASIHQCSSTTCAVARQPLVGAAEADPSLGSQAGKAFTVINVSTQQPFSAEGCQPSIWVGMHGM